VNRERIDKLLVELGLAESRTKAQALVMAGVVLVRDQRVEKPSQEFLATDPIRLKGAAAETRYVGRGGLKLERALDEFHICPQGYVCLDIGSSTGGFTDCLLGRGAASVVAVDAGTNQLAWKLRSDPRVDSRENVNARHLKPSDFDKTFDLAVMDVSFISVTKILPALVPLLNASGRMIVLIKPQFEVGRSEVGKGGIVRDPALHESVVARVNAFAGSVGLVNLGTIASPILGADGNREFLSLYKRIGDPIG
jgi:23S rRNA (cytidine1920-2'-O)/16S rRNA (cytidine1409-2'-O)-methyltransferase